MPHSTNPKDRAAPEILRRYRAILGINQTEFGLSALGGSTQSEVSAYEGGRRLLPIAIAEALIKHANEQLGFTWSLDDIYAPKKPEPTR